MTDDLTGRAADGRDIVDALSDNPLLGDLPPRHLARIAACCDHVAVDAGARLLGVGEPADHFWVILHGRVDIELHGAARGTLTIDRLGPGEVVGVSWIAAPFRSEFDATAIEPTTAIRVDTTLLRHACDDDHELGHELFRRFATLLRLRLHATRLQLLDLYGPTDAR